MEKIAEAAKIIDHYVCRVVNYSHPGTRTITAEEMISAMEYLQLSPEKRNDLITMWKASRRATMHWMHNLHIVTASAPLRFIHAKLMDWNYDDVAKGFARRCMMPRLLPTEEEAYAMPRFKEDMQGRHLLRIIYNMQEIQRWTEEKIHLIETSEAD